MLRMGEEGKQKIEFPFIFIRNTYISYKKKEFHFSIAFIQFEKDYINVRSLQTFYSQFFFNWHRRFICTSSS